MKFLKYALLVFFGLIYAVGQSQFLLSKLWEWELINDGYQYGDLYRLSHLSNFRDPRKSCTQYPKPAKVPHAKKVHLYIIGDSFTEKQRVGLQDFVVDAYTYVHWADFLHIRLDTTETNILLLESVERHFRSKMLAPVQVLVPDTATFVARVNAPQFMNQLDDAFDGSFTRDRLDAVLFQNDFFLKIKELKADFQYHFFNRVNESVTLVNDGRDMVFYMDTDPDSLSTTSSFHELEDAEVDTIVANLNKTRHFADSLGFQSTFLAIVPNKVSVLQPDYGDYNNLIRRVYQHPKLGISTIDVLSDFREMGRSSYLKGDSHWTCEGQYLWLNKVNAEINRIVSAAHL